MIGDHVGARAAGEKPGTGNQRRHEDAPRQGTF
jgi:hypothetical protein